jgi:hypothetical protein
VIGLRHIARKARSRTVEPSTVWLAGKAAVCKLCVRVTVIALPTKVLDCRCVHDLSGPTVGLREG